MTAFSATPAASPSETVAPFPELKETLRNADLELRLTNRGGGIAEAVLLNHTEEKGKRVTLNSAEQTPIGAIVEDPSAPSLPEYKMVHQGDAVKAGRLGALRAISQLVHRHAQLRQEEKELDHEVTLGTGPVVVCQAPGRFTMAAWRFIM